MTEYAADGRSELQIFSRTILSDRKILEWVRTDELKLVSAAEKKKYRNSVIRIIRESGEPYGLCGYLITTLQLEHTHRSSIILIYYTRWRGLREARNRRLRVSLCCYRSYSDPFDTIFSVPVRMHVLYVILVHVFEYYYTVIRCDRKVDEPIYNNVVNFA